MKFDTKTAAEYAGAKLDSLLERATRDTETAIQHNDIPAAVVYFAELRDLVKGLTEKMSAIQKHVDSLSHEILPTMFGNQDVITINVENVGRVSINDRWSAMMINKDRALEWLRSTGNGSLIIETVNAQTLGAFAKDESKLGKPLPVDIFKVGTTPYVSITKAS